MTDADKTWLAPNETRTAHGLPPISTWTWTRIPTYEQTPVDCLISELRDIILVSAVPIDVRQQIEHRIRQFHTEVATNQKD
jgi:hypothetical protein